MRQLYYTLITLLRGKSANVVKFVSLTLGLLVGVLLFSQIVYELNYDTCYEEHERLAMFGTRNISAKGEIGDWEYDSFRPAAAALAESLPDLVECATPVFFWSQPDVYSSYLAIDKIEGTQVIYADTLYFRTMGIKVLSGDPKELGSVCNAFLSQSMARKMFGTENPIGKKFDINKRNEITVRGVYEDLPGNLSFPHNMVISLPTIENYYYGQGTWNSNDIYMIYVRLRHAADIDEVNRRVTEVVSRYTPVKNKWDGSSMECQIIPATEYRWVNSDNVRRLVVLFVLGFSIFFVSGMNYVLAAIATIGQRAKMVGVHKCCGANSGRIMGFFLWETGLMMLAAIVCSLLLMNLFQSTIQDMLGLSSIGELFTWQTLWVPLLTVVVLFLLSGVLPGQMFAHIPVTQVFRRYMDDKRSWKRGLLFVQFMGVAFILGMLITSIWQYHDLTTRDIGFDSTHLAVGKVTSGLADGSDMQEFADAVQHLADDLLRQPYVEEVGLSEYNLLSHYSSRPIPAEGGSKWVQTHYQYFAKGFPQAVGMTLVEGSWPEHSGEALVCEQLAREMNWGDQVIGRELTHIRDCLQGSTGFAKVVGVVRDIRSMGFLQEQVNLAFVLATCYATTYHVRLKDPQRENLLRLNDYVRQTYSKNGLSFLHYDDVRRIQNENVLRFRNTVYMTSACILLIVLMGLIGYVADETQRRSKEIAVRKVNGAEASDILQLLSKGILKVSVGAVLIGIACAYYVSGVWMEQFSDCTMLSPLWFLALGVCLLVLIVLVVVIRAWKIANENPVLSIKAE